MAQGALAGGAGYVGLRARAGEFSAAEGGLGEHQDRVGTFGTVLAVLALCWLAYSALRIAVGVFDLMARRSVEGVVLDARERVRGDVLPEIVQQLIWARGDQIDTRQSSLQLTLEAGNGPEMWRLRNHLGAQLAPGQRVRLTTTPLTGYVKKVERCGEPVPATS